MTDISLLVFAGKIIRFNHRNNVHILEETLSFGPLLIVFILAFAVPMILVRFKRLRVPIVVG